MSIILIAAPEHLQMLRHREDFRDAQTFADIDALRALEVITRTRPGIVALERDFAATTRGTALINRIKADTTLGSCEIRIVAHPSEFARTTGARPDSGSDGGIVAVAVAPPALAAAPLDQTGTRRAPRFQIADGVDVMVDGNPATLIDLSIIGAQVVSATVLRPNQRLRMALEEGKHQIRFSAGVAWASFEFGNTGPRYRAGIEFFDADPDAVQKFCDAKKRASQA